LLRGQFRGVDLDAPEPPNLSTRWGRRGRALLARVVGESATATIVRTVRTLAGTSNGR
jgi:hypothetical protein